MSTTEKKQWRPPRRHRNQQSFVSGGTMASQTSVSITDDDYDEVAQGGGSGNGSANVGHHNVATHYNVRPDRGVKARAESKIIKMRKFNNFIKSVQIALHCNKDDYVLDLCCGKGGDFAKFSAKGIRGYIGTDIAHESIKQAIDRYNAMKFKFPAKFIHADSCSARLTQGGLSSSEMFDTVSCQFALHYSFGKEEDARMMLTNATERLKEGGKFLVTVPDAYVMVKKLRENLAKHANGDPSLLAARTIGNKVYRAAFDRTDFRSDAGPFGHRYVFHLQDAIDDCPEFLVPPRHFVNLCREYQLQLVEELNFHEFYERYSNHQEFQQLVQRSGIRDGRMTEDEWDAIYLYRAFVFQKKASMDDTNSNMAMGAGGGITSSRHAEYRPQSMIQINLEFNPVHHSEIIHLESNTSARSLDGNTSGSYGYSTSTTSSATPSTTTTNSNDQYL